MTEPNSDPTVPAAESELQDQSGPPAGLQPGDVLLGCRLKRFIRRDGFRQTWHCEAEGVDRALHVLDSAASSDSSLRFHMSAVKMMRIASESECSGILRVHACDPDGRAFLSDLWTVGTASDLPALAWELDRRLAFFRKVCEALKLLHDLGIVHGNLLPANVLLDDDMAPVLSDIGGLDVVTLQEDPATRPYVAPELARGEAASVASDIFSAGQLLHFLLLDAVSSEAGEDVPRLEALAAEAPAGLVRIARRCLLATPGSRYPSIVELLTDLANFASWETVGWGHPHVTEENRSTALRSSIVTPVPAPHPPSSAQAARAHDKAKEEPKAKAAPYKGPPWATPVALAGVLVVVLSMPLGYFAASMPWVFRIVSALGLAAAVQGLRLPLLKHRAIAGVAAFAIGLLANLGGRAASAAAENRLGSTEPEVAAAAVRQLRRAGHRKFSGTSLVGADLSGLDFSGTEFDWADLSGANLTGTNFSGALLANTEFKDANLSGASFQGADVSLSTFESASCDDKTLMPSGWTCKQGRPSH